MSDRWAYLAKCFAHQQAPPHALIVHRTVPLRGPNLMLFNGEKYYPIISFKEEVVVDDAWSDR